MCRKKKKKKKEILAYFVLICQKFPLLFLLFLWNFQQSQKQIYSFANWKKYIELSFSNLSFHFFSPYPFHSFFYTENGFALFFDPSPPSPIPPHNLQSIIGLCYFRFFAFVLSISPVRSPKSSFVLNNQNVNTTNSTTALRETSKTNCLSSSYVANTWRNIGIQKIITCQAQATEKKIVHERINKLQ